MVWECLCACLTTHLSGSLDGGAVFKKEFDDFNSILFARDVKWSESIQCSCVHFSLNVKRKKCEVERIHSVLVRSIQPECKQPNGILAVSPS